MTVKRLHGWRRRFDAAVDEIKADPFDWSQQYDCALQLSARLIEAMTGIDFAAPYRGRYSTRAGAIRVMRNAGFHDLGEAVASLLPEQHPSRCRIGDLVLYRQASPFGYAAGIVNGERALVLREEGIASMDFLKADRAFRVG